jgi:hypothetical protein
MPFCANCGNKLDEGVSACPNCGAAYGRKSSGGFNWGEFFKNLVLKPAAAFDALVQARIWWFGLVMVFAVGLFLGIGKFIDYGKAGTRSFFYDIFFEFFFLLFLIGALKFIAGFFKGQGNDFPGLFIATSASFIAYVPYALLALIPVAAVKIIFLILFSLVQVYLLMGVLESQEKLAMGPALVTAISPILFYIVIEIIRGSFGF